MSAMTVLSMRVSPDEASAIKELARRNGMTQPELIRDAVATYRRDAGAALIEELLNTFGSGAILKFALRADGLWRPTVHADVEPDARGGTFGATLPNTPLGQLVAVEASPAPRGRAVIVLAGHPHTDFAGLRVEVATVPLGRDEVTLTVHLLDLHPAAYER
jgi:predicted transcriptional regulator